MSDKIIVYKAKSWFGQAWRWQSRSGNHRITGGPGETFSSRDKCYQNIRVMCRTFGGDLTKLEIYENNIRVTACGDVWVPEALPSA